MLANSDMSTDTDLARKYYYGNVPDQLWEKCTYENVAEGELLYVRVATLPRDKYASILRVMS